MPLDHEANAAESGAASDESLQLYATGRQAMDEGQWELAAQLFERSVAIDPHHKTLQLLGACLLHLGRYRAAIVPLAAATSLNRGVLAPALLAEAFWRDNKPSDAEAAARLALDRDPRNGKALEVLKAVGGKPNG